MPFVKWRKFKVGFGTGRAGFSGQLTPSLVQGSSLLAAETILNTILLPANSLYKNGCGVVIRSNGHFASTGNNKELKLYAGTTVLFDSGVLTDNNKNWSLEVRLTRLGVGSNRVVATFIHDTTVLTIPVGAPNIDETADQTLALKGTAGTADADILSYGMSVEVLTI